MVVEGLVGSVVAAEVEVLPGGPARSEQEEAARRASKTMAIRLTTAAQGLRREASRQGPAIAQPYVERRRRRRTCSGHRFAACEGRELATERLLVLPAGSGALQLIPPGGPLLSGQETIFNGRQEVLKGLTERPASRIVTGATTPVAGW